MDTLIARRLASSDTFPGHRAVDQDQRSRRDPSEDTVILQEHRLRLPVVHDYGTYDVAAGCDFARGDADGAPREARSATGAGFKSNTVMRNPARARFSAMGFPILPRPINPIRSIVPNLLNYTAIFQIGERQDPNPIAF